MSFNIQTIPNHLALTGRIKSWLNNPADKLPVSCTSFTVEDSIEGKDGIDDSLIFTSYGLRNAQGVAVNLSKIRPTGTQNGKGLVASGPSSFALEYSLKNQVLRRGGTYKNGAVNLHLDYRHADVVDFVLMTREELPWAYRTLDVDDNFITHLASQKIDKTVYRSYIDPQTNKLVRVSTYYETALDAVLGVLKAGDLFLSKLKYDEDGNQLNSNVCLEIYFKPHGTCLLFHTNLGSLRPEEIPTAMKEHMTYGCELHSRTNVGNDGKYLSHLEDKQVGLGIIGLANLLANEDIKYLDFVKALEFVTGLDSTQTATPKAIEIASYIYAGYKEAAVVAKSYSMRAAFCVAPTATCSYQYTDRLGYTTTPEIAPPINVSVERDSSTFGTEIYYYPDNVETAEQVGYETFFRLNNVWQYMMNLTGLAHSISTNWWADKVEMNREFLQKWLDSYHMSLYYSLNVSTGTLDKSSVITLDDLEEGSTQNITPVCDVNKREPCIPCGE
jgi:hypothetical protein